MNRANTRAVVFMFFLILLFPVAGSEGGTKKNDAASYSEGAFQEEGGNGFFLFKCPFFPSGYAVPRDLLIKFFAVRTRYRTGKVKKLVFTLHTNRDLGSVNFRLYSGIPKNPVAVMLDLTPTSEVEAEWRDGVKIVFDALDISVPPGYPQAFLLKADTGGLSRGDWVKIGVDLCEETGIQGEIICERGETSREVTYLY
jgi:hypothetical protein